jgi:hypothetical protein
LTAEKINSTVLIPVRPVFSKIIAAVHKELGTEIIINRNKY